MLIINLNFFPHRLLSVTREREEEKKCILFIVP